MSAPDAQVRGADRDTQVERVWEALRWAAGRARQPEAPADGETYAFDAGQPIPVESADRRALLTWHAPTGWVGCSRASATARALLDLYLPICNASGESPVTVGHLGQGLDGYIATESGDSCYVTGPENLLHLHRMRALCDAIVVGAGTVEADNPQLTTRRASGDNPVRVILDPNRRLSATHGVFSDDRAPTLLVCDQAHAVTRGERIGSAEVLGIPLQAGRLDLDALIEALHARGLVSVFVEGGGHTVSAFLEAHLLDRLQVAIAPLITGIGRPGVRLASRQAMKDCLRPPSRVFAMGDDVLFDCDLRSRPPGADERTPARGLSRIL